MLTRLAAYLHLARELLADFAQVADLRSGWALLRLKLADRGPLRVGEGTLAVRMRPLGGAELRLRPGTTDVRTVADDLVYGYHLPPADVLDTEMRQICELGTNVGVGLACLAARYPLATLLGVEPDPANAALARKNLAAFGLRAKVVEAGIWDREGELVVEGDEEFGFVVRTRTPEDGADILATPALTIDSLLAEHMPSGAIDFLSVDVEGAEERVLSDPRVPEWPRRVHSIRVELHEGTGYGVPECMRDLERLGFRAWGKSVWWGGHVLGVRHDTPGPGG